MRRSLMTGCIFAETERDLRSKIAGRGLTVEALRARGLIVGLEDDVLRQLQEYSDAGVQRLMLQWRDLDDLKGLQSLSKKFLPDPPAT